METIKTIAELQKELKSHKGRMVSFENKKHPYLKILAEEGYLTRYITKELANLIHSAFGDENEVDVDKILIHCKVNQLLNYK